MKAVAPGDRFERREGAKVCSKLSRSCLRMAPFVHQAGKFRSNRSYAWLAELSGLPGGQTGSTGGSGSTFASLPPQPQNKMKHLKTQNIAT